MDSLETILSSCGRASAAEAFKQLLDIANNIVYMVVLSSCSMDKMRTGHLQPLVPVSSIVGLEIWRNRLHQTWVRPEMMARTHWETQVGAVSNSNNDG